MFIVQTIGVTFLCPHKKVTKESGLRGQGRAQRLAKSRPSGGCSLARACGRSRSTRVETSVRLPLAIDLF